MFRDYLQTELRAMVKNDKYVWLNELKSPEANEMYGVEEWNSLRDRIKRGLSINKRLILKSSEHFGAGYKT